MSEMLALTAYTLLFFAENYCSGVPLSYPNPDGTIVYGAQNTTAQMLDSALLVFNQALTAARQLNDSTAGKSTVVSLALIGKARTLLDMGRIVDADTVVSAVPTSFAYSILHDLNTTRQQNGVYNGIRKFKRYGVANREGGVGIPWRDTTQLDPRTPYTRTATRNGPRTNVGFDNVTPQYDQLRYTDEKASITLATGLEARG